MTINPAAAITGRSRNPSTAMLRAEHGLSGSHDPPSRLGKNWTTLWYHNVVQFFPSLEGGSCDPLNPCSARSIAVLGFLDLPVMAAAGFMVISVLLAFYTKAKE